MLDFGAVRVSFQGDNNEEEYWSGLQVGHWVFTTALPFLTCLSPDLKAHFMKNAHISSSCSCLDDFNILVLAQKPDSNQSSRQKLRLPATIKYIWKSDIIEKELNTILTQSSIALTSSHDEASSINFLDGGYFLAIHIVGQTESDISEAISFFASFGTPPHMIKIGLPITIVSTPFGLTNLYNSWSSGIISNIIGPNKALIIADVRLAPSCEGAPIYRLNVKELEEVIGIVMTPLITNGNEYSGYSFGITIFEIANSISKILFHSESNNALQRFPINTSTKEEESETPWETLLELTDILESIAVVKFPQFWGTGVVVGNGFVMTSSHVINYGLFGAEDLVLHLSDKKYKAEIVYASSRGNPIDLAVLSFNPDGTDCKFIKIASNPPKIGENVLAIGYSTFISSKPNVSAGIVSNASPILSTTCLVQTGMSGGALIRSDGTLIGIIESALKSDHFYPNFNHSVSSSIFGPPFENFLLHQDSEVFHKEIEENAVHILKLRGSKL